MKGKNIGKSASQKPSKEKNPKKMRTQNYKPKGKK